jgi:hypothetical protein
MQKKGGRFVDTIETEAVWLYPEIKFSHGPTQTDTDTETRLLDDRLKLFRVEGF